MRAKISVCIATYNGRDFLEKSLGSILCQLNEKDEIIIVDDASTDNTVTYLESLKDERIKLIQNPRNLGVGRTFCKGLSLCAGEYIFLADQDDIWDKDKIDKILVHFEDFPNTDLIIHNGRISQDGEIQTFSIFDLNRSKAGFWYNFKSCSFTGCCMAIRRDSVQKIIPSFSFRGFYHDHYLGLMATLTSQNIYFMPEQLITFNRHENNASLITSRRTTIYILMDRLKLVSMLFINSIINLIKK